MCIPRLAAGARPAPAQIKQRRSPHALEPGIGPDVRGAMFSPGGTASRAACLARGPGGRLPTARGDGAFVRDGDGLHHGGRCPCHGGSDGIWVTCPAAKSSSQAARGARRIGRTG